MCRPPGLASVFHNPVTDVTGRDVSPSGLFESLRYLNFRAVRTYGLFDTTAEDFGDGLQFAEDHQAVGLA